MVMSQDNYVRDPALNPRFKAGSLT